MPEILYTRISVSGVRGVALNEKAVLVRTCHGRVFCGHVSWTLLPQICGPPVMGDAASTSRYKSRRNYGAKALTVRSALHKEEGVTKVHGFPVIAGKAEPTVSFLSPSDNLILKCRTAQRMPHNRRFYHRDVLFFTNRCKTSIHRLTNNGTTRDCFCIPNRSIR